jgi:APA family basic amino acid/polyamine antiporter
VVLTWINSRGLKVGAGLSSLLVLLILLGIAAIVVFGLSSSGSNITMAFDTTTKDMTPITVSAVFTAMLSAFWAYEGWNSVGFLGGEIKNPTRNVPLSITFGLLAVIAVYLLANITYLSLLPGDRLEEIFNTKSSIAAIEAAKVFWGSGGVFLYRY